MKKALFLAPLLALALVACDNKDAADNQPATEQVAPAVDDSAAQVAPAQPAEQAAPATEEVAPATEEAAPAQPAEQVAPATE